MDNEAAIQKHIDNRPMRHLNRDRDDAGLARDRSDPVSQLRKSGAAVREFTFSRDPTARASRTQAWCFSEPQSTAANQPIVSSAIYLSLLAAPEPPRRLPIPVPALEGATSYWASAVANLPGHKSKAGARGTGARMVAPGRSARAVSLRR